MVECRISFRGICGNWAGALDRPKTSRMTQSRHRTAHHVVLHNTLPPGRVNDASNIALGITEAGARHDRYAENRDDWQDYGARAIKLRNIADWTQKLRVALVDLDVMSRDDLRSRIGPGIIEEYIGSLTILFLEIDRLRGQLQKKGKPSDVARERWILDMADIFENAFAQAATVSGSGDSPTAKRGRFYKLLDISRPSRFAQHGNLSPKYVKAVIATRKRRQKVIETPEELTAWLHERIRIFTDLVEAHQKKSSW
jgi:hypothetical protein